jgi:hypothetical protein
MVARIISYASRDTHCYTPYVQIHGIPPSLPRFPYSGHGSTGGKRLIKEKVMAETAVTPTNRKYQALFHDFNTTYFNGKLPKYRVRVVEYITKKGEQGRINRKSRRIRLSAGHDMKETWKMVCVKQRNIATSHSSFCLSRLISFLSSSPTWKNSASAAASPWWETWRISARRIAESLTVLPRKPEASWLNCRKASSSFWVRAWLYTAKCGFCGIV